MVAQIEELAEKYLELLGYVQTGTFVEVGASDGRRWSNSYSLARMGWYGHYIEAVPEYAKICAMNHARHPRVLAIGDKEDYARVHVGSSLSTCSDQMRKLYDSLDWTQGYHTGEIVSTRQHSLEYFLRAVGIQPRFELLIVDVEGYEWEVFRNFNISEWSPQVVIVEIEDEHDSFKDVKFLQKRFRKLRSYFQDHGYDTYWKDKINTIFVYRQ
ncbi:hypothetical protein GUITHDRAFT_122272 [Guillardia theta CCMP2712]|uniref:Methyltransferase FkbM domain-containing protein n=1 Tax=Guillardia theta (strain CCMP2712) TaxID=905079 RepID=L1I607_GUITC|nr:hypothetical protein GUITHDRAFT_122272 [Guillardia theta CCMP2712]EKX31532.1 hypothetical protein GUITHDRAFT_122272 [Guillardia theta CCMP2712]|eukprot:XP_005818512.1 hypothetical protein GUITHDRAFT_122272 [Guillardia theta CCMP2712]